MVAVLQRRVLVLRAEESRIRKYQTEDRTTDFGERPTLVEMWEAPEAGVMPPKEGEDRLAGLEAVGTRCAGGMVEAVHGEGVPAGVA